MLNQRFGNVVVEVGELAFGECQVAATTLDDNGHVKPDSYRPLSKIMSRQEATTLLENALSSTFAQTVHNVLGMGR